MGWACARGLCVWRGGLGASVQAGGPHTRSSDCRPRCCTGPGWVSGMQPSLSHGARSPRPRSGAAPVHGEPAGRGGGRPGRSPQGGGPRPSSPHGGSSCGHLKTGRTGAFPSLQTPGGPVRGSPPPWVTRAVQPQARRRAVPSEAQAASNASLLSQGCGNPGPGPRWPSRTQGGH